MLRSAVIGFSSTAPLTFATFALRAWGVSTTVVLPLLAHLAFLRHGRLLAAIAVALITGFALVALALSFAWCKRRHPATLLSWAPVPRGVATGLLDLSVSTLSHLSSWRTRICNLALGTLSCRSRAARGIG